MSLSFASDADRLRRHEESLYLKDYRKIYERLKDEGSWNNSGVPRDAHLDYAQSAYWAGFHVLKVLTGTFEQFLGYLNWEYNYSDWYPGGYWKRTAFRLTSAFYDRHGGDFRDRMKYRRDPAHEKKPPNPKAAWREHKHIKRDKSRGGWRRYGKAGRWGKNKVARANRRHARKAIRDERDETCTNRVQDICRLWWD